VQTVSINGRVGGGQALRNSAVIGVIAAYTARKSPPLLIA